MFLEIFTAPLRHQMDGDTRRIGGNQGSFLAVFVYLSKNLFLNLQVFDDHLNNPVAVFDIGEIVLEISGGNSLSKRGIIQGCRFRFEGCFQGLIRNLIACGGMVLFIFGQIPRNNIQHQDFQPNIGKMTGDTRSHYSGTQDGCFFDSSAHMIFVVFVAPLRGG